MKQLAFLTLLVGLFAGGATGIDSAAASATLVVDRDHVQCPNAAFSSIEAAVQAAAPGDTIVVCPDTYDESVTVDKPLSIRGPGVPQNPSNVKVCTTGGVSDPTTEAIVDGLPFAFLIDSDGVTLNGLVIQGPRSESATGVLVGPFGGYDIVANLFQNNAQDIRLQGSSPAPASSEVRENCFRGIGPLGLGIAGFGIVGFGINDNTAITDNTLYRKGVGVSLSRSSGISIRDNLASAGFFFLQMQDARDAYVTDNTVTEMQQTAISGRATNVTIANNDIEQSGRDAIAPSGTQLSILDNTLANNRGSGIDARPNTLQNSTIDGNLLKQNSVDGIEIEAENAGNVIANNTGRGNGLFDCYDSSVGPGTAGTANEWINDTGQTENRPGLCN